MFALAFAGGGGDSRTAHGHLRAALCRCLSRQYFWESLDILGEWGGGQQLIGSPGRNTQMERKMRTMGFAHGILQAKPE